MKKITWMLSIGILMVLLIGCDQNQTPIIRVKDSNYQIYVGDYFDLDYTIEHSDKTPQITFDKQNILVLEDKKYKAAKSGVVNITIEIGDIENRIQVFVLSKFEATDMDGEVTITGYLGTDSIDTLVIPDEIYVYGAKDNKAGKVKAISSMAFKDVKAKEVIISSYIERIDKQAFFGNSYIEKVTFKQGSKLTKIENFAFSNMKKLSSFHIPSTVISVGENVFFGSPITHFESENKIFEWIDDVLIETYHDGSKNALYVNPTLDTIRIPDHVEYTASNIFKQNKTIKTVDLNQVEYLGVEAFKDSTIEEIINVEQLKNLTTSHLSNTQILNKNETIVIGKSLLKYVGTAKDIVILEGIEIIGENVFSNLLMETVVLPNTIKQINQYAFTNNKNLKWILIDANMPPIVSNFIDNKDMMIYVRNLTYFKSSLYYQEYTNIKEKKVKVDFFDKDNQLLGSIDQVYFTILKNHVEAPKIDGYIFKYWINQEGQIFKVHSTFLSYKDEVLKPYYEKMGQIKI